MRKIIAVKTIQTLTDTYPPGKEFSVSEEEAKDLMSRGVAKSCSEGAVGVSSKQKITKAMYDELTDELFRKKEDRELLFDVIRKAPEKVKQEIRKLVEKPRGGRQGKPPVSQKSEDPKPDNQKPGKPGKPGEPGEVEFDE